MKRLSIRSVVFAWLLLGGPTPAWAGASDSAAFFMHFDSSITSTGSGLVIFSHVKADFLVNQVSGNPGHYRGTGRLRYTELSGLPGIKTDGVLAINDLQISLVDGTVVLRLFPGDPIPSEWLIFPPAPPTQFFQWCSPFLGAHQDEFGVGGFTITNWEYSSLDIYASKTYDRTINVDEAVIEELTVVELIAVSELPRIDKLNIESTGSSVADPETGKQVDLTADLFVPFPFMIERCTWTGNNISGSGSGDPEDQ